MLWIWNFWPFYNNRLLNLKNLYLLYFFFINFSYSFNIYVFDKLSKKPIESVNIFSSNKGITTNSEGFVNLGIFNDDELINFSSIGYKLIKIKKVNIVKNIYLERENLSMEMIHVTSANKSQRKKFNRLESDLRIVLPYAKQTAILIKNYEPLLFEINKYPFFKRYFEKKKFLKKLRTI